MDWEVLVLIWLIIEEEKKFQSLISWLFSYLSDPVNSHLPVFISLCLISPSCVNGKSPPGISLSLTLIFQTLPKNCFTYPCLQYHSHHFGKWQISCHLFPDCSVCPNASPFFLLAATLLWRSLTSLIFFFLIVFLYMFSLNFLKYCFCICRALTSEAVLLQKQEYTLWLLSKLVL